MQKTAEESATCECQSSGPAVLLPCSGGSNCGQIANHVAVKLTEEGLGSIYCLAGVGAHIEGMIETLKKVGRIVALDGCPVACAKKAIEHAGLKVTDWICVTDQGIEKVHEFNIAPEQLELVAQRTRELLARPVPG